MIQNIESYIGYFESIRRRTLNYLRVLPADKLNWSPKEGELTCADLIRHLGEAERMFVGAFVSGNWTYRERMHDDSGTLDMLLSRLDEIHADALTALRTMTDTDLSESRPTLDGPPIKAWRLLMMIVEHEIHHRSQFAMYLTLMDVKPPHIYGIGLEDVIARATS